MQNFKLILAFLAVVFAHAEAVLVKRDVWMVDKGYNEHREQWYKYDCRRVSFYKKCSGLQGGMFHGYNEMFSTGRTQSSQLSSNGWMAQTSPLQIYFTQRLCLTLVALAANKYGKPIAIGTGSVSQVIRCNNRGKWVARLGHGKWIRVKDAFCYLVPSRFE